MPSRRITAVLISAAALILSTLVITATPATADYQACGTHTHTDKTRITGGWKVKVRIHYHNCGSSTVKVRPDVANRIDPGCTKVSPNGIAYWSFSYSYYDGFEGGNPYYRRTYNC